MGNSSPHVRPRKPAASVKQELDLPAARSTPLEVPPELRPVLPHPGGPLQGSVAALRLRAAARGLEGDDLSGRPEHHMTCRRTLARNMDRVIRLPNDLIPSIPRRKGSFDVIRPQAAEDVRLELITSSDAGDAAQLEGNWVVRPAETASRRRGWRTSPLERERNRTTLLFFKLITAGLARALGAKNKYRSLPAAFWAQDETPALQGCHPPSTTLVSSSPCRGRGLQPNSRGSSSLHRPQSGGPAWRVSCSRLKG